MTELEKCREAVQQMYDMAFESSDKATEYIAKHRIVDKVKEVVQLKEERIEIIEGDTVYDTERLMEIANKQDELLRDIKGHGMPHHPVMCSKSDWNNLEVKQVATTKP